jgi:peroxiredoxin
MESLLPVLSVVLLGLILVSLWVVLYQLVKQQGRLLLRLDHVESHIGQSVQHAHHHSTGVPVNTVVSPFSLPDLTGTTVSLERFRGQQVLLVNWNPSCGYCDRIAPALAQLQEEFERRRIQLLLVSHGDVDANARMAKDYGLTCPILLSRDSSSSLDVFHGIGTPAAYLVDKTGRTARPIVIGADEVPALARELTNSHQKRLPGEQPLSASRLQRDGLQPGTIAPVFTVPDLHGGTLTLADYHGRHVLLVFTDPHCGPCDQLAPDLARLHWHYREQGGALVMISRGNVEENRQKAETLGLLFPIGLQQGWEISRQYGIFKMPVAFLIDAQGVIAQSVASGVDEILSLAHQGLTRAAEHVREHAI